MKKGLKKKLYISLIRQLNERIVELESMVVKAREARDDDTKSSAGDKYETAREMIQMEINKTENLLSKNVLMKVDLEKVNILKEYSKVEFGSLVFTNNGTFFLSIPYGKIEVEKEAFLAITLVSPIGQEFKDKKVGDTVKFQDREYIIENIV